MTFHASHHSDKRPSDGGSTPSPADKKKKKEEEHEEEILDEGIEDSFPASDPPSTSVPGTGVCRP